MAILALKQLWINLAETGVGLTAPTAGRSFTSGIDGEVRTYAGGRQRFISRAGTAGQFAATLLMLTVTQLELLESWTGQVVRVRDHRGQAWWGVFTDVTRLEVKNGQYHAGIAVRLITHDEGV